MAHLAKDGCKINYGFWCLLALYGIKWRELALTIGGESGRKTASEIIEDFEMPEEYPTECPTIEAPTDTHVEPELIPDDGFATSDAYRGNASRFDPDAPCCADGGA
jgi:hypothetical protein